MRVCVPDSFSETQRQTEVRAAGSGEQRERVLARSELYGFTASPEDQSPELYMAMAWGLLRTCVCARRAGRHTVQRPARNMMSRAHVDRLHHTDTLAITTTDLRVCPVLG